MPIRPKDGKRKAEPGLEEVFKSHHHFGLQALKELKRAERYCEFLSIVILDLAGTADSKTKPLSRLPSRKRSQHLSELRGFIGNSVRETDLVSGFEENRLGLLLAETPLEGAKILAKRLEEGIRYFFQERLQVAIPIQVPLKIISYPNKLKGREEIYSTIQEFIG